MGRCARWNTRLDSVRHQASESLVRRATDVLARPRVERLLMSLSPTEMPARKESSLLDGELGPCQSTLRWPGDSAESPSGCPGGSSVTCSYSADPTRVASERHVSMVRRPGNGVWCTTGSNGRSASRTRGRLHRYQRVAVGRAQRGRQADCWPPSSAHTHCFAPDGVLGRRLVEQAGRRMRNVLMRRIIRSG